MQWSRSQPHGRGLLLQGHLQWAVPCTVAALHCRSVCVIHHRPSERPAHGHLLRGLLSGRSILFQAGGGGLRPQKTFVYLK